MIEDAGGVPLDVSSEDAWRGAGQAQDAGRAIPAAVHVADVCGCKRDTVPGGRGSRHVAGKEMGERSITSTTITPKAHP